MARVKKITSGEGCKAPFRLFGNINHTPRTFTAGEFSAVFSVRPMRADERAKFRASEERLNNSHDWAGARIRAGVAEDMTDASMIAKRLGVDVEDGAVLRELETAFLRISAHKKIIPEEYELFAIASREAVINTCQHVIVDNELIPFTADVWESLPESVQLWLMDEVMKNSTLTEEEEVGL